MSTQRRANGARRWASFREALASELWPVPTVAIAGAVALGILLPILDRAVDQSLPPGLNAVLFSGGTDSARAVLSAIAGSLITATSLTFSLTVVALQLASSQASPRLLRMFAADRMVHATLAVFLGTFAYSLTVLRSVADAEDSPFVPRIAVTVASLLTFASIIMLTVFLAHLARQLRVETMMRDVHDETLRTIELIESTAMAGVDPAPSVPSSAYTTLVASSGFVTVIDRSALVGLAHDEDIVIAQLHAVGVSVIQGTPLARWWDRRAPERHDENPAQRRARIDGLIAEAHLTDYERTPSQDLGFGLRQLVDIAVKALSPGVNDPTTAVHALSHISAILRSTAALPLEPAALTDEDGIPRVIQRRQDYDDLVEVALAQPRRYGAGDPEVAARLYGVLAEIAYGSAPAHHRTVRTQCRRLDASVRAATYDRVERAHLRALSDDVRRALVTG